MELFEAIAKRHSYRGKYKDLPVSDADIRKILTAGIQAPSGYNTQTTTYVVVTDPALKEQIAALHPVPVMQTAPVMLVALSESKDTHFNLRFELEDYAASVENVLLAMTALGYAGVWIDGMMKRDGIGQAIGEILHVPAGKTVRAVIPVGVPEETVCQKEKKPFEERVHYNAF